MCRGPAPIHYALLNHEQKTYVNIIDLHEEEFDKGIFVQENTPSLIKIGNILSETEIDIEPGEIYTSLLKRVAIIGAQQIINTLKNFDELKYNQQTKNI